MKIIRFFVQIFVSLIRMLFVGGITSLLILYFNNLFTDSNLGVDNLIRIIIVFLFFPVFFVVFFEVYFYERRKFKNKKHKVQALYTNK